MGSNCQCPDFQVRYFCMASQAEQQQFCDKVASDYASKKRSYYRELRDFADENIVDSDTESQAETAAEDKAAVASEQQQGKRLLELLKELVEK